MKRILKLSSMLLILVCVFMLFACSDDPKNTPVEATPEQQALVADVVNDFSSDGKTLAQDLMTKAMTVKPAKYEYSASGVTLKFTNENDGTIDLALTYSNYRLSGSNGTVSGSLALDSSVPSLEGTLRLSGNANGLDGKYNFSITSTTGQSGSTEPLVKVTKDGLDITFTEDYLYLLLDASKGMVNALMADYTIKDDGIAVSMKGSMNYADGKVTMNVSSMSYDIDNIKSTRNTYSFYLSGSGSLTFDLSKVFAALKQGSEPKLSEVYSGSMTLNAAELKVGNDTLSVDGFTLSIDDLMKAIDDSTDLDKSPITNYITSIIGNIRFRINGQAIDINSVKPQIPQF